ncbi:25765_t:CDS:1 [Dentiscutata erythropus]|uniref:25765_t:CDS:1 n=1 Tax=Dentiscutata erythropus TaxID=1348616 RepID=A0A9N9EWL4_9GLOM|nr:25765_t:CDS:1 [Dentiscutata erythropus]
MDKTQNDNAYLPPLNQNVIFSEPSSILSSQQNTSVSPTAVKGNSRLKSRITIDVGRCSHKTKDYKPRSFSLDSGYKYYCHPQYNIYNQNDNNYELFCRAYKPQLPESLVERRRSSSKYPIYGYSSSDDKLYDSPSTKLYPYTNIFMGSKVNNEKNGDSENLEFGKEITKEFLYNFEAWKEQFFKSS